MQKLQFMLHELSENKLGFTPTCPTDMLVGQLRAMMNYQQYLLARAECEGIPLPKM